MSLTVVVYFILDHQVQRYTLHYFLSAYFIVI